MSNLSANKSSPTDPKKLDQLSGNELIIQGGLEAGFSFYTGYPGSPLAEFFNILYEKRRELKKKGIKVVIGNSEANAAAMASGAKQAGRDVLVGMKSMGLHVAADALSVGNFSDPGPTQIDPQTGREIHPGVVIVVGDDPWSLSTSTPADSRYLFKHLHIPFLEPATPQELKDWIALALKISKKSSVYMGLILTTYMAEGGGRVRLGPEAAVERGRHHLNPDLINLTKSVMVPPNSAKADTSMIRQRFPRVVDAFKEVGMEETGNSLDKIYGPEQASIGFITSGATFETTKQVFDDNSLLNRFTLYKLSSSYPLIEDHLLPWLKSLKALVVVEEKRGFLENELSELLVNNGLTLKVFGKKFTSGIADGFPADGGLNYEIIRNKIIDLLPHLSPYDNPKNDSTTESFHCLLKEKASLTYKKWGEELPIRLPTFCPGCPHRETLSLLKEIRHLLKKEKIDLITHGDVGCYSLSFLPPFREMHNLSAMGQGGALGAGLDLFTTNPSVILMGDSTFFHSGLINISNSVQLGHQITYILLDNDNTAMTGHQMTPVSGLSVEGETRPRQKILPIVKNLGVDYATEVNPSDRYFYKNLLLEVIQKPGVKVIVSNKECALTFYSRKKNEENQKFARGETLPVKTFYQINSSVCEDCRVCIENTGCPGLSQTFDAYGPKVTIDAQICVNDGYCTKIKACPAFEEITVKNYYPQKYLSSNLSSNNPIHMTDLPDPTPIINLDMIGHSHQANSPETMEDGGITDWRVVIIGVGGSGVSTLSKILASVDLGDRTDLDLKFIDQKGLAQRNGRVISHFALYPQGRSYGVRTPTGTGDLLLSPDLLDGSSALYFLSSRGQAILDQQYQAPLTALLNRQYPPPTSASLKNSIVEQMGERITFFDFKKYSHKLLGKYVYASAMLLGVAYQKGLLPFTRNQLQSAFHRALPTAEVSANLEAFHWGRILAHHGSAKFEQTFLPSTPPDPLKAITQSIEESLPLKFLNPSSKSILEKFHRALERLNILFPDSSQLNHAQYLHDILVYDPSHLDPFLRDAERLSQYFSQPTSREQATIALRILVKTYFIKDEIFVSHQLISPLKAHHDREKFKHLGSNYTITHINRPSFTFMGRTLEFDLRSKRWMLVLMRQARWLRRLLPKWHLQEKKIAETIRRELLGPVLEMNEEERTLRLVQLDSIKGYREVRYERAREVLGG